MYIDLEMYDGWKRRYTLAFSKKDFDYFCAGCPESDCVQGRHGNVFFQIFHGITIPDAFRPLPDGDGYFIEIGVQAPIPEPGISSQEFDRLTDIFCERLGHALTQNRFSLHDNRGKDLGYVVMKIEG